MPEKVNRMLAKGAESRERLVDAAIECFARHGFEGTSVRAIAEQAGVTFQLIRHHFGSKEDLWAAAARELWDRAQELFARAMSPSPEDADDPKRALRHFALVIIEYNAKNPSFRRMFTHEFFAGSDRYRRILRPHKLKLTRRVLEWLNRYAESGTLTRFTPEEALLFFLSLVAGTVTLKDEYEYLIGRPVTSKAALELQADLLAGMLFEGRGLVLGGAAVGYDDASRPADTLASGEL
jgi:TetR/AcrR family transcriptional regulator